MNSIGNYFFKNKNHGENNFVHIGQILGFVNTKCTLNVKL